MPLDEFLSEPCRCFSRRSEDHQAGCEAIQSVDACGIIECKKDRRPKRISANEEGRVARVKRMRLAISCDPMIGFQEL
jgi:hypothetical protein